MTRRVWDTVVLGVPLAMQGYEAKLDFQVMHLARADIYLGREWLYNLGPTLHRSYQDNSLEFMHEGRVVRLQGEPAVLTAPLISSIELCQAINDDNIQQVYVCTLLHQFISADEVNEMNKVSVDETNLSLKNLNCLGRDPYFSNPVLSACEIKKNTKAETLKRKYVDALKFFNE